MIESVTITTGARLHFGPLAAAGATGGRFGGLGMMISGPRYVISARRAPEDSVTGEQSTAIRVAEFLRKLRQSPAGESMTFGCHLEIRESIPSHAGLGSGTQLGLAVARVVSELIGEHNVPIETLARRTGRGLRSAIGLHGFTQGGFLVDGGRTETGRLGTLVSRVEFPADWRLLLVTPSQVAGLSGADEQRAFASQPPMPQALTANLCRIALMDWLPGILEADFNRVANAMYEFGLGVGRFFEPAQGGVFANPAMSQLADEVRQRGFAGVAQTSWGPTICVLCESESFAHQLLTDLANNSRWSDCLFRISQPLNQGAVVTASCHRTAQKDV